MKKEGNGSREPILTIRASLNKVHVDLDKELVMFFAKKRQSQQQDEQQTTLDNFME